MEFQHTISSPISFSGVGLHTGVFTKLQIFSAPPETGIVFRRVDLDNFEIEANIKNVARVAYATTLMKQGVLISTVEHLLSSLYTFGIDNAWIDINNLEVPILDGSALPFTDEIQTIEDRDRIISIHPARNFQISYSIDFDHPLIYQQDFNFNVCSEAFATEIAPARTFGFFREVEELKKKGLIRGGSLDNAIVLTEKGILNDILRFKDEFVRHKVLDSIGDLALIGKPLIARIVADKAGHALHTHLVNRILNTPSLYSLKKHSQLQLDLTCKSDY